MPKKRRAGIANAVLIIISSVLFGGGLYLLSLVAAPTILPYIEKNTVDVSKLDGPKVGSNRVIIPKINVDIAYGEGTAALDRGAQWRYPERGNPEKGGNFIIAAHRFSLAATPQATLVQSPFYHIDKLAKDDEIIVDYNGKRYGYKVDKIYDVKPTQVEIEAPSSTSKMTLYTCSLGGASDGRVVIEARPLGEVTIQTQPDSTTS
ncbi:MAG TPA: class E sortase [Patescibacteria group bacterium]|nr:class E sortase [Patescibacteria group bacterium]